MNILFLSVYEIQDSNSGYIYADLVREFSKHGHNVFAVTPTMGKTDFYIDDNNVKILKVKNGQIQKTGKLKKAINLLMLEKNTIRAINNFAHDVKFDLIINVCSNLCFSKTSRYFQKKNHAILYVLLKDIFPQNAVDIEMMKTTGIMGLVFRFYQKKEEALYRYADYIGCMSLANQSFITNNNPKMDKDKLRIVPNSIAPKTIVLTEVERLKMREKYGIPQDKIIFVYGGNLGKPQSVPFIIECLKSQKNNDNVFFYIVGDGTEYTCLEDFTRQEKMSNVKIQKRLPREDFDEMVASCDVGMIFLDYRFTVPNYPSRLLSYMQAGLPVFACTDVNTDIGRDIIENGFGWWCESNNLDEFVKIIREIEEEDLGTKKMNSRKFLSQNFSVEKSYHIIMGDM